jgi:hypothetical protein
VRWLLVWRLDTMAADGSRLLTMVATLGACGSTRSRGCRCATVVRLSDVVRGARLRGDALDGHQPAEERRAAQGPLPCVRPLVCPGAGLGACYDAEMLTWDLVCFAVPTSRVELVLRAVRARHPGRQFYPPPPMCEVNQFSSWSKTLSGSARFAAIPWR